MNQKSKKFLKNVAITTVVSIAGGIAGAELTDLVTDSKSAIAIGSTAAQYIASFGTFFPLHARDNRDIYRDELNKFKWREFTKDALKLTFGFAALDVLYVIGRPIVNYRFQKAGYSPFESSLLSDAVCMTSYFAVSLPLAKILGVIREKSPARKT